MYRNLTTQSINVNSAAYRSEQRTQRATVEQRIAHIRRWLDHNGHLAYTATYKERSAELARLEGGK